MHIHINKQNLTKIFIIISVDVLMHVHVCHSTHMQVRRQNSGSWFSSTVYSKAQIQAIMLVKQLLLLSKPSCRPFYFSLV